MAEARRHRRIACERFVDLHTARHGRPLRCRTSNISLGGLFARTSTGLREGDALQVALDCPGVARLLLDSQVTRISAEGSALMFFQTSIAEMGELEKALTPGWDGEDLLDGVVRMAPWYHESDLAGWMRLTSLVSGWSRLVPPTKPD